MTDLLIRGGLVIDGTGARGTRADVAIKNGRFAKVGRVEGRGAREIDAQGDYVSPGWIDMMDQSGEILLKNGLAENKLREGVTTAIAGEGELMEGLRELAGQLGIRDEVFFLGRCDNVADLLFASEIGVLSSKAEGFANAILEYMAADLPVVATDVGGARVAE